MDEQILHAKVTSGTENTLTGNQIQQSMMLVLSKLQNRQPLITMPETKTLQKRDYAGGPLPRQRNGPSATRHTPRQSEEISW